MDTAGYSDEEILPAVDWAEMMAPMYVTDHSTTAYRKNADGTFTEDAAAYERLREVELKMFKFGHPELDEAQADTDKPVRKRLCPKNCDEERALWLAQPWPWDICVEGDEFDGKALDTALKVFGVNITTIGEDDYGYALDLAAALEYFIDPEYSRFVDVNDFAVALDEAVGTINMGDYMFDADIETTYDLGEDVFYRSTKVNYCVYLEDYIDFERLGEDIAEDTKGKFTRYGFFAPEAGEKSIRNLKLGIRN